MQKRFFPWILFLVLAISLVGLMIFVRIDREEISALRSMNDELSKKANVIVPVVTKDEDYHVVTVKNVYWNNQLFQFEHRCKGTLSNSLSEEFPFFDRMVDPQDVVHCIGENQLALVTQGASPIVLQTITSADGAADFVSLLGVDVISKNGTALIKFSAAPYCDGVGCVIAPNAVSAVMHLNDLNPETSFHVLKNFPVEGKGDWNADGTKAIFYPDTMNRNGASGSDGVHLPTKAELVAQREAPLIGYNLATDTVSIALTPDQAAYYYLSDDYGLNKKFNMVKYDNEGSFLPTWMTCINTDGTSSLSCSPDVISKWIDNDNYEAVIAQSNGTLKKVEVKF